MESIFNKKFDRLSFTATGAKPSVFNFSYDDYNGRTITIPVSNVDELPALISKQPQYIRCQSEKFWNWFIGTDVPLSPKQLSLNFIIVLKYEYFSSILLILLKRKRIIAYFVEVLTNNDR